MVPKDLPFSGGNSSIRHFRHALSLDERRVKFIPSFYINHHRNSEDGPAENGENEADKDAVPTDFEEVFFAGAHCGSCWIPSDTLLVTYECLFRCRRWFCGKWHTSQPRSHHPSMDG